MADVESEKSAERVREEYQAVRRAFEEFTSAEIGSWQERIAARRLVDSLAPYLAPQKETSAAPGVTTDLYASNDAVVTASKALFDAVHRFSVDGETPAARELGQRAVAAIVRAVRLEGWPRGCAPAPVDSPLSFEPPKVEDYKREAWRLAHAALDDPDDVHKWVLKARVLLVHLANPDPTEAPFARGDETPHCETCGAIALHWEILNGKTACVHCVKRELDRVQAGLNTEMACVSGLRDEVRRADRRAAVFESALRSCPTACPIRHRPAEYGLDDRGGRYSVMGAADSIVCTRCGSAYDATGKCTNSPCQGGIGEHPRQSEWHVKKRARGADYHMPVGAPPYRTMCGQLLENASLYLSVEWGDITCPRCLVYKPGASDVTHHAVDPARPVPDCLGGSPQEGTWYVQTLWRGVTCAACLAMRVVSGSDDERVADVVMTTVPEGGDLRVEALKSRSCPHNGVEFWDLGKGAPAPGPLEWCKHCGAIRYVVAGGEWCEWRSPSTIQVPVGSVEIRSRATAYAVLSIIEDGLVECRKGWASWHDTLLKSTGRMVEGAKRAEDVMSLGISHYESILREIVKCDLHPELTRRAQALLDAGADQP